MNKQTSHDWELSTPWWRLHSFSANGKMWWTAADEMIATNVLGEDTLRASSSSLPKPSGCCDACVETRPGSELPGRPTGLWPCPVGSSGVGAGGDHPLLMLLCLHSCVCRYHGRVSEGQRASIQCKKPPWCRPADPPSERGLSVVLEFRQLRRRTRENRLKAQKQCSPLSTHSWTTNWSNNSRFRGV